MSTTITTPLRLSRRSLLRLRGHPRTQRPLHASAAAPSEHDDWRQAQHQERERARRRNPEHQVSPLQGYYKLLLDTPFAPANPSPPALRTPSAPAPDAPTPIPGTALPASPAASSTLSPTSPPPSSSETREQREARARIVFGSRLAGPLQREQHKRAEGRWVAGVFVPPQPEEPDNCCMSGCVNCVLSQFIDDLEEWKKAKAEAERRLRLQREREVRVRDRDREEVEGARLDRDDGVPVVVTAEEEGGGGGGLWEGYEDIPIGLRVFMENEKRLKRKKAGRTPA